MFAMVVKPDAVPPKVGRVAEDVSRLASSDPHLLPGDSGTRRYRRVFESSDCEAWVIRWPRGTGLELHDHGGSSGLLRVVRGALIEAFTDLERPDRLRAQVLLEGDSVMLGPSRVHDVWNPRPDDALTVHVYWPPLASMTFYDGRSDRFLRRLRTESSGP